LKVLNLYAGIGGNRKLWEDVEVTAVEINPQIAEIYKDFFPNDNMVVSDAHEYLLENFEEFDFIWSSPPCPTHSKIRRFTSVNSGQSKPCFPDMKLYEEIIFLKSYFEGKFCVENVVGYYEPLIRPKEIARHYFWSNFHIFEVGGGKEHFWTQDDLSKCKGFDISKYKVNHRKDQILRNCVNPNLGLHILNESKNDVQSELFT